MVSNTQLWNVNGWVCRYVHGQKHHNTVEVMTKKNQVEPSPEEYNSWFIGEKVKFGEPLLLEQELEEYERKAQECLFVRCLEDFSCFDFLSTCFRKHE